MDDLARKPEGQSTIGEELAAIPYEPLLPVEKRLIAVSLILGVALLGLLSMASSTLFPVPPASTSGQNPAAAPGISSPAPRPDPAR